MAAGLLDDCMHVHPPTKYVTKTSNCVSNLALQSPYVETNTPLEDLRRGLVAGAFAWRDEVRAACDMYMDVCFAFLCASCVCSCCCYSTFGNDLGGRIHVRKVGKSDATKIGNA